MVEAVGEEVRSCCAVRVVAMRSCDDPIWPEVCMGDGVAGAGDDVFGGFGVYFAGAIHL